MEKTNIPKLARNKYNYTGQITNSDYVTATQLQNKIPGSGGGGGNNWTIQQQNKIAYSVQERAVPISGSYINGYMIESATYDLYMPEVYRTENLYNDDVKTINGYSLIGDGDIEVEGTYVDLSAYVTKVELSQELASYVTNTELSAYATKTDLDSYTSKSYLENELTYYVTNTYLETYYSSTDQINDTLSSYVTKIELEKAGYATRQYVKEITEPVTYIVETTYSEPNKDTDFVIIRTNNAYVTLPSTNVDNGHIATLINQTTKDYYLCSDAIYNNDIIDGSNRASNMKQISYTATQYIYYGNAWYQLT